MADVKISALTAVVTPATTDIVPVVQGGVTKQETVAQIRTVIMPVVLGTDTSGSLALAGDASGTTAAVVNDQARGLKSATTTVSVSAATAPTSGQVLTATAGTTATWQTPTVFTAPTGSGLMTTTTGAMDAASSAVGTGVLTFLGTPSGANLASALTTALPDSKGGTGLTALGASVATMLGTFSSANIKTACTDETGSGGGLVFATSPTLTTPVINGQTQGATIAISAMAIDWTLGQVFTKTLAAGANTFTFSGQTSGMLIVVRVTGAASTLTWPTVKWPAGAAPTQTASGIDVYTFVYDGTTVFGSVVQAMA